MSKQDSSRYKSEQKNSFKDGSARKSSGFGSGRTATFRPAFKAKPKRVQKEFNPLTFIKKVEEQPIATVFTPINMFADFLIDEQVKKNIISRGYKAPTPIQDQVIPVILEGKDVIASANTGTGKTAAFLIPLVHNVLVKKTNKVLIITPTRELADQIQSELDLFKRNTRLTSVLCIGGLSIGPQIQCLKREHSFVIGTPGRLRDLENNGNINFSRYDAIVLDEVDTMLDMGFINDIKDIISKLPERRHSLFFSATIPTNLKEIMNKFLRNPVTVSVKTRQSSSNVNQDIIKVGEHDKVDLLHDSLIKPEFTRVIIFLRTKRSADKLAKRLRERGFNVATIHGDKSQAQRRNALILFKNNKVKILLATDVVARGIDIDDVSHVINFELPATPEDYIHRIGRTGRAEKTGNAITFVA